MAEEHGLVSIVMPCWGQLEHVRMSVPRVLRHSRPPFEMLFLDAGSLDGTGHYLEGVAAAAPVRVEVLRPEPGEGFAAVLEKTLARARGAFIAWVNSDVLVPPSWLHQLMALL